MSSTNTKQDRQDGGGGGDDRALLYQAGGRRMVLVTCIDMGTFLQVPAVIDASKKVRQMKVLTPPVSLVRLICRRYQNAEVLGADGG